MEVPQEQVVDNVVVDYTKIPAEMDKRFEKFDDSNALRPTIIKISETWEKDFQKSLLSAPEKATIYAEVSFYKILYNNNTNNYTKLIKF